MFWPCEARTSTCRSFATISSGLYRFLAIAVLLDVKDIPQVGPLQWGWIKGGLKFLEAAHVKDVLSVLRWCENLHDRVAGFRVLQLMPGIGPSTAAKILDQLEAEPHASDVLYDIKVPRTTVEDWPALAKLFEQMRQGKTMWPAEL